MSNTVTVRYTDNIEMQMSVEAGQTILDAAEANGVPIVNECQSGICGTCVADCVGGDYELGRTEGLSDQERENGKILTCQTEVLNDCVLELQYPANANAARLIVGEAVVESVDLISETTAILTLDASSLPEKLQFRAGQFAQLRVPGTDQWRNYSYAHLPNDNNRLEFVVRLLPTGKMSDYLRHNAKPGDKMQIRGSKGSFYLREVTRPVLLMAGGTGISAILPIAQQLVQEHGEVPVCLYFGVTNHNDLCKLDKLEALSKASANFQYKTIVANAAPAWNGPVGFVTDLLDAEQMADGEMDVYLCGPPPMVEATRHWLTEHGLSRVGLFYEKFLPSGGGTRSKELMQLDVQTLDYDELRQQGKGTAVVIGGSIAGISTSKVLLNRFKKVIVLEKDSGHHMREGRPGAAQGWHLHHLLMGGQRELETIFPGIIDDMVKAGAFRVDMAEQYRLYMAGSWKKVCKSGIEIVCAGRPLLEWCIRRRLDNELNIDFRYDTNVQDLIYDPESNQVLGVGVVVDGELKTIPAEFVVDASGKNTPVPRILDRLGIGSPEVERDNINCFYSTMWHEVPPEKQWDDKVMIICYAYRPAEEHYSAQYYTNSSRRILSTSLVGYNCYSPPRNDREFREFAKRMPNSVIRNNLEGLKPCSPVYNFRYPDMMRLKYEDMANLPGGLVAIGDAYTSADPVSGAGMTKALLELRELKNLLPGNETHSQAFVKNYYKRISRIADLVWFVVREQNLRYPWIKDVEKKRSPYFRLLTWYMDRVTELIHDDMDAYRQFLSVVHFVSTPSSLMTPRMVAKVLGKWAWTKLRFRKTLIEKNFSDGNMGNYDEEAPRPVNGSEHGHDVTARVS